MEVGITGKHGGMGGGVWYVGRVGSYHFEALVFTESSQYGVGGYHVEALVFTEPSQYGIDGGQVSKLYVWAVGQRGKRGKALVVYERGWELEPDEDVRVVVETLVAELSRRERKGRQTEE